MRNQKKIVTRCGYRCDLCLAYKPNVDKKDERVYLCDGWFKIYGFRIPPQDIVCAGCLTGDNPVLIDTECPVRPCVISKGIKNCAYCREYICDKLKQRVVSKKQKEKELGRNLTREERKHFVKPYESKERLDKIRKSLGQSCIQ